MNGHVEFGSDTEYTLRCLRSKPIKGEVTQRCHFLLRPLLEGVGYGIKDRTNDSDAGGLEFKVLSGRGGREDDFTGDDNGASDA